MGFRADCFNKVPEWALRFFEALSLGLPCSRSSGVESAQRGIRTKDTCIRRRRDNVGEDQANMVIAHLLQHQPQG